MNLKCSKLALLMAIVMLFQLFGMIGVDADTGNYSLNFSGSVNAKGTSKALSQSSKDLKVIGILEDTAVAKNWKGHDVLNDPNWTLAKNDQWVNAGIKNKQDFYIASPMTEKNLVSTNPKYPGPTVYAREIDMLKNAGYVQKGDYFIHPSNLK